MNVRFFLFAAAASLLSACNDNSITNRPIGPTAVITGAKTWAPLDTAAFDGSLSYVQDNTIVGWKWTIVSRPTGSMSEPVPDADPSKARFWIDVAGNYTIELEVTDGRGMTGTADYEFSAVPWQALHVELIWDKDDTDLDVHLVSEDEGGTFFNKPFDCFFDNTDPDWGTAGSLTDDPSIDIDDVDGFGPENVSLNQPVDGHHYHVFVHYYDDRGHGSTNATVRIYLSGQLRFEGIQEMPHKDAGWDVATITWASGDIKTGGGSFEFAPE